jgi:glucan phosphoethanolaminetransferase (alkaline phosphatase superfamily)
MSESPRTLEQKSDISQLIEASNTKLEHTSETVTTHAFNLGCSVGLIPGGVIVLIALIVSRGNLPTILITALLMLIGLLIFASLAAFQARSRTLERLYQKEISPKIEKFILETQLSWQEFGEFASEILPAGSLLLKYLPPWIMDQNENSTPESDMKEDQPHAEID